MNILASTSTNPAPIIRALEHVRQHHPEVTRVVYDQASRWLYLDEGGKAPTFGPEIDVGILEDAADSVIHLPAVYEVEDESLRS